MTVSEKAATAFAVGVIVLLTAVVGAYRWAGTVPRRPRDVAANAVFLWAPNVGFPGPRRGWWLSCWRSAERNRCKLSGVDGDTKYEGEFISYGDKGVLRGDQLQIDGDKTGEHKVWVGNALVPLVYLKNGEVLIPASSFEEGTRLLEQLQPKH